MNALNEQVQDELHAAAEATENRAVRAVIIYGGEKVFAAGADIKEMAGASYTDMVDRSVRLQAAFTAIARIPKPVVAAVTGARWEVGASRCAPTSGFAVTTPSSASPRSCSHHSGCGWHAAPARLVDPARAKDLVFSGRFVEAVEALEMVSRSLSGSGRRVRSGPRSLVAAFVAGPAYALGRQGRDRPRARGPAGHCLEIERQQFAALFATEDRGIGMTSFVEHGPGKAKFVGR